MNIMGVWSFTMPQPSTSPPCEDDVTNPSFTTGSYFMGPFSDGYPGHALPKLRGYVSTFHVVWFHSFSAARTTLCHIFLAVSSTLASPVRGLLNAAGGRERPTGQGSFPSFLLPPSLPSLRSSTDDHICRRSSFDTNKLRGDRLRWRNRKCYICHAAATPLQLEKERAIGFEMQSAQQMCQHSRHC